MPADRMPSARQAALLESLGAHGASSQGLGVSRETAMRCVDAGWVAYRRHMTRNQTHWYVTDSGRAALQRYRAAHPERLEGDR